MTTTIHHRTAPADDPHVGAHIEAIGVDRHAGRRQLLHGVTLSILPGELVAIAGGTGAGKTTLLETLAGVRPPTAGTVGHDGVAAAVATSRVGYVPQDDIVHRDLPLRRALRYTAQLQLPRDTAGAIIDRVVDETLVDLDLADRADVRIGSLSGGQRKRASIAAELLTRPRVFFLDEPTAGLDPATAADVLALLRRLADSGVTVVLTTHAPADIDACDRVVFLARGGHVAFDGTPTAACDHFGVTSLPHVYRILDGRVAPASSPIDWHRSDRVRRDAPQRTAPPTRDAARVGPLGQWAVLTRRNADTLVRNRLTSAVMVGSPALVIAMMAVLFRPGAFADPASGALAPAQTMFWISFAGFFFGLTYGLLQIVGEMPVVRRERSSGLSAGAYLLSKVTVLLPVLALVAAALLAVLQGLDRLPALGWATSASLFVILVTVSACALTLGLLASAIVADATQATLTLPMICFPQVLFAGAVVPNDAMAAPGRLIGSAMATRWGFESLGRAAGLGEPATGPVSSAYGTTFVGSPVDGPVVLVLLTVVFGASAVLALRIRTR